MRRYYRGKFIGYSNRTPLTLFRLRTRNSNKRKRPDDQVVPGNDYYKKHRITGSTAGDLAVGIVPAGSVGLGIGLFQAGFFS